jgi:hypothetical protein
MRESPAACHGMAHAELDVPLQWERGGLHREELQKGSEAGPAGLLIVEGVAQLQRDLPKAAEMNACATLIPLGSHALTVTTGPPTRSEVLWNGGPLRRPHGRS